MSIKPLHDNILISRIDAEAKTPAGLFIPDNAKERPLIGVVVAVGDGKYSESGVRIAPSVKAGDRVLFPKFGGTEIDLNGEKLLMLKDSEIHGIVE
jgi:chaperonin GroES